MIVAPRDTIPAQPNRDDDKVITPVEFQKSKRRNRAEEVATHSVERPLGRPEKTKLLLIAKKAYDSVKLVRDDIGTFDEWRKAEALEHCKVRISEAQVKHFSAIKRHFLNLAGEAAKAFQSAMREGTEGNRVARAKLEENCAERGLNIAYAAAICRRQFKCSLEDASAKQLWCLVFTVRNRRAAGDIPKVKKVSVPGARNYTVKAGATARKFTPKSDDSDPF